VPPERRISLDETLREMFATLSNRSILVLLGSGVFSGMGVGVGATLGIYFGTYYWDLDPNGFVALQFGAVIGTVLSVIVATPLTRLMGKKYAAISTFIVAVISLSAPLLLREAQLFPPNGSPLLVPLLMLERCITTACGIAAGILGSSMVADVVEETEIRTGLRAEGLLTAANTFVGKAVSGFGIFSAGLILAIVQFPEGAQPGAIPADTLSRLALVEIFALVLLFSCSILCLFGYRISRASHADGLKRLADKPAAAE
jgi:Na+/melibiose symporter-like transporter